MDSQEQRTEAANGLGRAPASVTSGAGGPRIEVTAPEQPARFVVTDRGFPTFPVSVGISAGDEARVDRRTLKVVARKGLLFKNITADILDHLTAVDCATENLCSRLALDIDEFDLSEKGAGRYRFAVTIADNRNRRAAESLIVEITQGRTGS